VQCGLLRALGMQLLYGLLVIVCLFLIGLPVMLSLAFPWGRNLGLVGMWYGMPAAYVLLNVALFATHQLRNWEKYSDWVVERERLARFEYDANALDGATSVRGGSTMRASAESERLVRASPWGGGGGGPEAGGGVVPPIVVAVSLPGAGGGVLVRRSRGESASIGLPAAAALTGERVEIGEPV